MPDAYATIRLGPWIGLLHDAQGDDGPLAYRG
jgi:hypothetical protein